MSHIKGLLLSLLFFSFLLLVLVLPASALLTPRQQRSPCSATVSAVFLHSESRAQLRNQANYETMLGVAQSTKHAFEGTSVLLTGASGGLGKEIALQLAECHVRHIVLSGRNRQALEAVANECHALYPSIVTTILTSDLSDKASVQKLGEEALKACSNNKIDVLINNGGVSSRSDFVDTSLSVDETLLQINFLSGAALAKAVVPAMISHQSGRILWISSVQGLIGIPSRTSYAASKFAVEGYCQSLRAELASSGVSVHVASPGYIRTNLSQSALKGDGTAHGKLDETTANGSPPNEVAVTILDAVAKGQSDILVAATVKARVAIWLRFLAPSLLQKLLVKQYEKSKVPTGQSASPDDEATRPKID
jgi:dehydrogenase/reductase SDR family member 7B